MPSRTTDTRRSTTRAARSTALILCALLSISLIAALIPASALAAKTKREKQPAPTLKLKLSKEDMKALRAKRKSIRLVDKAEVKRQAAMELEKRLEALQALVDTYTAQEETMRKTLEERLAQRYMYGEASGMAQLLSGTGLVDSLTKAQLEATLDEKDQRLAEDHEVVLQQLRDAQAALREERNSLGDGAAEYEEKAAELDHVLAVQQDKHMAAQLTVVGDVEEGVWSMKGDPNSMFGLGGFAGAQGFGSGSWDGGTRTPSRKATPEQIASILSDGRIDIYAAGRQDIASGQVDGRLIDALRALAMRFGSVRITSLKTGHGVYTTSGNVSEHSYGCAADIGSLGGILIQPSSQGPGSITDQGVRFLAALTGDLAPHQVISLISIGGPTLAMGDHGDHIHLGYSCG